MTRYPEGAVPALEHQRMGMPPPMTETIYCQEPQYIMQTVPVTQQIRKIVRPPVRYETVEQTIWEPRTVQIVTYKEVTQFRQVDVEKVGCPDTYTARCIYIYFDSVAFQAEAKEMISKMCYHKYEEQYGAGAGDFDSTACHAEAEEEAHGVESHPGTFLESVCEPVFSLPSLSVCVSQCSRARARSLSPSPPFPSPPDLCPRAHALC